MNADTHIQKHRMCRTTIEIPTGGPLQDFFQKILNFRR